MQVLEFHGVNTILPSMGSLISRCASSLLAALVLPGCFTTQPVALKALGEVDRLTDIQIVTKHQGQLRAVIAPGFLGPETLRYLPLRYGPANWMVRFAGWPAVYTAG